jgi:lysophospholipase L1-like esterase
MKKIALLLLFLPNTLLIAQEARWWNPANAEFDVIEGQAWPTAVEQTYDRLPFDAKEKVRNTVWNLSKHSAGLMIRFRSNASEIKICYGTYSEKGASQVDFGMNHMPATGVSGVDLYAIDSDGKELWLTGQRHFGDTITYNFDGLRPNDAYHDLGREYRLYLPLYNQVEWLKIGTSDSTFFRPLAVRKDKPIVVYGTSIAHGAVASRPGMAWTSILSRKMDRPLINLGFSGNGRLEPEVIGFVAEIDAKIFILDCLPNLTPLSWANIGIKDGKQLEEIIKSAVRQLRIKNINTPILLVEQPGYTESAIKDARKNVTSVVNEIQKKAFYELKKEGIINLYYLSKEEINLQQDDMVDGTHPTDLGMMHYAEAYEKSLRKILKEPIGSASTTKPVIQYREPHKYDWEDRHLDILAMNEVEQPKTVIFANSIIHFWGGLPRTKTVVEEKSWEKYLTPLGVRNLAYGWDRIENVLWRVYHGELDGISPENILVMIGTNNFHLNTDSEILEGLDVLIKAIKERQPQASIQLMGILPRRNNEERIVKLNQNIAILASKAQITYADLGDGFLKENGKINEKLYSDGLHPNADGYLILREGLMNCLTHN